MKTRMLIVTPNMAATEPDAAPIVESTMHSSPLDAARHLHLTSAPAHEGTVVLIEPVQGTLDADLVAHEEDPGPEAFTPRFDEDVAPMFARLLDHVANRLGAPSFAADLACMGAGERTYRIMADRWREGEFTPESFADTLDALGGR